LRERGEREMLVYFERERGVMVGSFERESEREREILGSFERKRDIQRQRDDSLL